MDVQTYLFFDGRCEEAIEFYRKTIGAELVMMMRFKDAPPPSGKPEDGCASLPPNSEEKVMHAALRIGGTMLLASDGECGGKPNFQGFTLSLQPGMVEEAQRFFTALSEGGQVRMPLGPTFFAKIFGIVADKFGVGWMVYVPQPQ
jgi:PhnB protein